MQRGPLVYALKVEEEWKEHKTAETADTYWEVFPASPWNYGIPESVIDSLGFSARVSKNVDNMPWNLQNAPIQINPHHRFQMPSFFPSMQSLSMASAI